MSAWLSMRQCFAPARVDEACALALAVDMHDWVRRGKSFGPSVPLR